MKLTPTPLTAALAGGFSAMVMPALWPRLESDSVYLMLAFVLLVALPAHAFVVGFPGTQASSSGTLDTAMLKRVVAWLAGSAVVLATAWALRA